MFLLINFDGWNVGCADYFNETFLEFDDLQDALHESEEVK